MKAKLLSTLAALAVLPSCLFAQCDLVASAGPDIRICPGEDTVLGASVTGGTFPFFYQWTTIGVGGSSLNNPSLLNPTLTANTTPLTTLFQLYVLDDDGCEAWDTMQVFPANRLSGIVKEAGTGTPITAGFVYLVKAGLPNRAWEYLDTAAIQADGSYLLETTNPLALTDSCVVYAVPDRNTYDNAIPTYPYYANPDSGVFNWQLAEKIVPECSTRDIYVIMVSLPTDNVVFEGNVEGCNGCPHKTDATQDEGWPDIDVILTRTPPGSAVIATQTDVSGHYSISGIESSGSSTYSFFLNVPGLVMRSNYVIQVMEGNPEYILNCLDFMIDTTITDTSITGIYKNPPPGECADRDPIIIPGVVSITGNNNLPDMLAYPNPFTNECTFIFPNPGRQPFQFTLYDLQGKLIHREEKPAGETYVFSAVSLEQGMYIAEIKTAENSFRKRILFSGN